MESLVFLGLAAVTVLLAVTVVCAKSPLRSALALIVVQCALACIYVLLQAPFVAAMQVLVYAGAIMVLFLFVIMLLNLGDDLLPQKSTLVLGKTVGGVSMMAIGFVVVRDLLAHPMATSAAPVDGQVAHIGALLYGRYLFAFETVSVLLLCAVVGSVVLNLKRLA